MDSRIEKKNGKMERRWIQKEEKKKKYKEKMAGPFRIEHSSLLYFSTVRRFTEFIHHNFVPSRI